MPDSAVLNNNHSPWVFDDDKGECYRHPSPQSTVYELDRQQHSSRRLRHCWKVRDQPFAFADGVALLASIEQGIIQHALGWGAVCKNIISDRFSTKTAISGRDSYLCMQRCALSVRAFSFSTWRCRKRRSSPPLSAFWCKKRMLSQKERAESEPFDRFQRYLCMQR